MLPSWLPTVGDRGRRDQHRPGRLRRRRDRPHRPQAGPRRAGLQPHRPQAEDRRRGAQPLRPAPPTRRRRRCGSTPASPTRRPAWSAPACGSSRRRSGSAKLALERARHPGRRAQLRQLPDPLRLDQRAGGAGGLGDRGAAAGDLRRPRLGLLGAQPRPRPVQGPLAVRRGARQGRADHRRLLGDRQGGRGQGRRRRRDGAAGRPLGREAGGDQSGDRGGRRASPTSTAATCPTSRTSSGWPRRCSPTTATSTSSSTTPAARSAARSTLSYDRFHDYERTMQLNYFGARAADPGAAALDAGAQVGPHHQHQLDRRPRPTRRASRPTSPRRRRSTPSAG